MKEIPTPLTDAVESRPCARGNEEIELLWHARQLERDRAELIGILRALVIVAEEEMSHVRVFPELDKARALLERMRP